MNKTVVESRDDLSRLLGQVFDSFSLHPETIHNDDWPWPVNYTRQMLATLVRANIVTTAEDGEGETYWQCWKTYDDHEFAEVLGDFDAWFNANASSIEGGNVTASTGSSIEGKPDTNTPCFCGCGEACKGFYRPGHDARHAGNIGRLVAQDTLAGEDDPARHYNDLPSDKLVDKARKIADKAVERDGKSIKGPVHQEGIIKVGKTERVARKFSASNAVSYLNDGGEWVEASKTAAKTFQVG